MLEFSLAELQSPSNPASPQAVRNLSVVDQLDVTAMEAEFHLDDHGAPPPGAVPTPAATCCPICLESLVDGRDDAVLQMPCAKQHMFHRACLLQWLHDNNSCPVRLATPLSPSSSRPHVLSSRGRVLHRCPDCARHAPTIGCTLSLPASLAGVSPLPADARRRGASPALAPDRSGTGESDGMCWQCMCG